MSVIPFTLFSQCPLLSQNNWATNCGLQNSQTNSGPILSLSQMKLSNRCATKLIELGFYLLKTDSQTGFLTFYWKYAILLTPDFYITSFHFSFAKGGWLGGRKELTEVMNLTNRALFASRQWNRGWSSGRFSPLGSLGLIVDGEHPESLGLRPGESTRQDQFFPNLDSHDNAIFWLSVYLTRVTSSDGIIVCLCSSGRIFSP